MKKMSKCPSCGKTGRCSCGGKVEKYAGGGMVKGYAKGGMVAAKPTTGTCKGMGMAARGGKYKAC